MAIRVVEFSGFVYNDSLKFEAVHCQPQKGYKLQQNGFFQTYLTSDDVGYCRVTIFPKGKLLIKKLQKNILWIQISNLHYYTAGRTTKGSFINDVRFFE